MMPDGTDSERRFLFVVGSARVDGSSETLARHAAAGLPAGVAQDWKRLSELPLAAFREPEPTGEAWAYTPSANERVLFDATLRATDLVMVSPLYWYNVSASIKLYLDYWGGWLRVPALAFRPSMRGKTMWAVTALGGQDPADAGPLIEVLRRSADYLCMRWGGVVVGNMDHGFGGGLAGWQAVQRAKRLFQTDFPGGPRRVAEPVESGERSGAPR